MHRTLFHCFLLAAALCAPLPALAQKSPQLARTPQMGWNSWNTFGCNVDEKMIRQMADAMVASGMKDAGYEYVNIDDCWHGTRDADGNIRPDPKTFPSGMKALADYVHARGLKLGIYSDAGDTTCAGRAGSRGHEYQGRADLRALGRRLRQVRLVRHEGHQPGRGVHHDARRDRAGRAADAVQHLRVGRQQAQDWAVEVGHSLAHRR